MKKNVKMEWQIKPAESICKVNETDSKGEL